jgi:hypothetical protein
MDIEVSQKMTLKLGEEVFEITSAEAEKLYSQLFNVLGKHNQFQLSYPTGVRQYGPETQLYGGGAVAVNAVHVTKGNK